jgi:hypothetical protein
MVQSLLCWELQIVISNRSRATFSPCLNKVGGEIGCRSSLSLDDFSNCDFFYVPDLVPMRTPAASTRLRLKFELTSNVGHGDEAVRRDGWRLHILATGTGELDTSLSISG